jgi:RNA polymerase sigma factor (sigma-70 family)
LPLTIERHMRDLMAQSYSSLSAADPVATARETLARALVETGEQNRHAFRQVYQLTSAKLFGICVRICGDRQAAEDVLHDVYLTVWKRAGGYEPSRSSPITWLATIARNRAIDWRRSAATRRAMPLDDAPDIADDAPTAAETLVQQEAEGQLHLCLDALEANQRESIRSAFFGGLTYAELAERKAMPIGTMKSWIRRGLIRLKACLDDL